MASPKTKGRMINKDISDSKKFAELTPAAGVLFCMIIPHLNSYGKMNGGPGYIKDEVCPRVKYLTEKNLKKLLQSISDNTNMKWFEFESRHWIHAIKFLSDHQKLVTSRLGSDLLPSYSGLTLELVIHEVEGKEEVEVEEEVEGFLNFFPQNFIQNICFALTWAEWEQERKKKKNTLTEAAVKRQANTLGEFSPCQASKMVDQSLKFGYTGIFELKDSSSSKGSGSGKPKTESLRDKDYRS